MTTDISKNNIANLVSVKKQKEDEEEKPYRENIVKVLKELIEKAEEGNLNHFIFLTEDNKNEIGMGFYGFTNDIYRVHYVLEKAMPDEYFQYYIASHEDID